VHQRLVQVEVGKKDRYGREVGRVLLDGLDVNLELLRHGLAWHYKAYEREQPPAERMTYAQAERSARERGVGLWSDARPVAPWDFRKGIRDTATAL
jgi:endonuclease YncB( thermonuclease family)